MRQTTLPEQTAKLIELGFEKPRTIVDKYYDFDAEDYKEVKHYSIGELIEMLPNTFIFEGAEYSLCLSGGASLVEDKYCWQISYIQSMSGYIFCSYDEEFIDALYKILIRLKDKGVI